jgi:hypothetical protein
VQERQALYNALEKAPDAIFPLRFSADPNLATGISTGQEDGFYRSLSKQPPAFES